MALWTQRRNSSCYFYSETNSVVIYHTEQNHIIPYCKRNILIGLHYKEKF